MNQFDLDSLEKETDKLHEKIKEISEKEQIALSDWLLVGYSNGANIAAHLLLERETKLNKGLFFHPMSLGVHQSRSTLEDKTVWLSYDDSANFNRSSVDDGRNRASEGMVRASSN